jgi:thiamine pyrophosphate-dependent acetolactate synthase large subunit-like protein
VTPSATFGDVDYAAVARAMGAGGTVVTDADELDGALATALEGGVHLVDVRTSAAASPTLSYGKVRDGAYR